MAEKEKWLEKALKFLERDADLQRIVHIYMEAKKPGRTALLEGAPALVRVGQHAADTARQEILEASRGEDTHD